MLTDENQAVEITVYAAIALGMSTEDAAAQDAESFTTKERTEAHKLVEAILAHAIKLGIVAPRRFVDLRQI